MAFEATVFRVLIASPGDVSEERQVIPEVINEWNAVSAAQARTILMPVKWESHAAPVLGGRPQGVINDQIVRDCDLLVGVFWTRIGTHTGVAVSGTAEEIEHFVQLGKPVMLYFSGSPIDPNQIDLDQFTKLRAFKEKMRLRGLTESYAGTADFRQKFTHQLGINLNGLLSAAPVATPRVRRVTRPSVAKGDASKETARPVVVGPSGPPLAITDADARTYVNKAVEATADEGGWADIAAVGNYLRAYTPIDWRSMGFTKLKEFLESVDSLEMKALRKSPRAQGDDTVAIRKKVVAPRV